MADYGLLAGLAEGIKSGVQSYQDTKRYNDEQQQKAKQAKMGLLQAGFEEDPTTGGLKRSALYQQEMQDKLARDAFEREQKHKFDLERIEAEARTKKSAIDPLENRKKLAEIKKIESETSRGKMLPSDKVLALQEGAQIPTMLQDIKGTLESSKDMFGPVAGRLATANPYNEKAKTADAQIRTAAQSFGKFMEGGVLRKEDEEKYRKMFPNLSDTPEVAANKLAIVERLLTQKQAGSLEGLRASGYDIEGLSKPGLIPELPKVLTQQNKGLIDKAVAAPKVQAPKAGSIEEGYRFKGGNPDDPKNWEKVK